MKFRKFGKALLMSALSLGAVFSVTSCVQSYTVGFLYVTGLQTGSSSSGTGIISGFKIDHNTGQLTEIHGLPIASGGQNPERAVLLTGSRFLYVLNKGTDACVTDQPCKATANIVQFAVGGNGVLSQQGTFYTQGYNPFRLIADSTGSHLYVLDHDAPSSAACAQVLGAGVTSCGDVTGFSIDTNTGRLSTMQNAQASANGQQLSYFPVPANPIDFVLSNSFVLTLSGTPATGDSVFPYAYALANGQLTISQNTSQPLNIGNATAIQTGGNSGNLYVLDNDPITIAGGSSSFPAGTYAAQILPYTVGTGGSLQAQTGGAVPDTGAGSQPLFIWFEAGQSNKWAYVANFGTNSNTNISQSSIAGYDIDTTTHQLTNMPQSPFGTGAGPRCLVEDPSNNFLYTANFNDSTVTGHTLDHNEGVLKALNGKANKSYSLPGPATYCVIDGRTS
ncbi:lactonase family protein [Acidobacteria bacterium AB60]|nr:lactonase family protein [Acidobacteria bacterium AB60]